MAVQSVAEAQQRFMERVRGSGAKYDAKTSLMQQHWAEGLRRIGAPPGPVSTQRYNAGVAGKGSRMEQAAIAGAGKWRENFVAGLAI